MTPAVCHLTRRWPRIQRRTSSRLTFARLFGDSSSSCPSSFSPPSSSAGDSRRPSTASKPLIDIRHVRENVELYEKNCIERNYVQHSTLPARITSLFGQWKELQQNAQSLRQKSNILTRHIALTAETEGTDTKARTRPAMLNDNKNDSTDNGTNNREIRSDALDEARQIKEKLSTIRQEETRLEAEMEALALSLPNLTNPETPRGEPRILGYINSRPEEVSEEPIHDNKAHDNGPEGVLFSTSSPSSALLPSSSQQQSVKAGKNVIDVKEQRSHVEIGTRLGLIDFVTAASTSGWGWYYLLGEGAQLEQALVQYALAAVTRHGWTQIAPPSMVYGHMAAACGFQPRDQSGEQQIYTVARTPDESARGRPELCLTGTSEIPLAAMKAGTVMREADMPTRTVAVSRCFRAEAGSRGASTRGLYRVHEFTKVEMFAWTAPKPAAAAEALDEIVDIQSDILGSLGLHCRILEMPAADLGASAWRKCDVEAFFPSRRALASHGWGELASASICTDYQTRRLATRLRLRTGALAGFPWTVNGTALAVPRVIAALIETGWDPESDTVLIPECLRPWMDGKVRIGSHRQQTNIGG